MIQLNGAAFSASAVFCGPQGFGKIVHRTGIRPYSPSLPLFRNFLVYADLAFGLLEVSFLFAYATMKRASLIAVDVRLLPYRPESL